MVVWGRGQETGPGRNWKLVFKQGYDSALVRGQGWVMVRVFVYFVALILVLSNAHSHTGSMKTSLFAAAMLFGRCSACNSYPGAAVPEGFCAERYATGYVLSCDFLV